MWWGRRVAAGLCAIALVVVTAACTAADTTSAPDATPAGVNENPAVDSLATVTPEQVDAAVADIPDSIKAAMAATDTPGIAVGVVYQGEVVYAEGFGVRDVDSGEAVDAETVFPLASVSKSLGATAIARVIDDGLVTWETPVAENLPGFTLSDPYVGSHVTIADMYAHRSGLYEHAGDELEEIGYDRATILERLRYVPLEPFRAVYHYGNFDITAAGESVARAAGEDWADLSERVLYEPLGMTATSSRYADLETRENRALGHVLTDDKWTVTPTQRQPDEQAPAGGVSSNIVDLSTWMRMVLAGGQHDGEQFIAEATLLPAISPQIVAAPPETPGARAGFYGYGYNVGTTAGGMVEINHSGAFALGAGTVFKMLPEAELGIVVLANASANGVSEAIAGRFADIAQYGAERRDWLELFTNVFADLSAPSGDLVGEDPPADPEPARPLDDYAGSYANDYFGPAEVTVSGSALELALGPTGRWTLEHWDGDIFVFPLSGENGMPGSISQATFDGDTLVLEHFNEHGMGVFTR